MCLLFSSGVLWWSLVCILVVTIWMIVVSKSMDQQNHHRLAEKEGLFWHAIGSKGKMRRRLVRIEGLGYWAQISDLSLSGYTQDDDQEYSALVICVMKLMYTWKLWNPLLCIPGSDHTPSSYMGWSNGYQSFHWEWQRKRVRTGMLADSGVWVWKEWWEGTIDISILLQIDW
jgi:hypothetical protein